MLLLFCGIMSSEINKEDDDLWSVGFWESSEHLSIRYFYTEKEANEYLNARKIGLPKERWPKDIFEED